MNMEFRQLAVQALSQSLEPDRLSAARSGAGTTTARYSSGAEDGAAIWWFRQKLATLEG